MKGELMPGFNCTAADSATTETTGCSKKICNADLERKDGARRDFELSLSDRRVRSKLHDSELSGDSVRKSDVSRTIRPSGGKDRHSKVNTSKGPRDRRVRLSVSTAIQFYDVQDRLGYDQPSKAVEWLMKKAKTAIDELPPLPTQLVHSSNHTMSSVLSPSGSSTVPFSAQSIAGPLLTSVSRASETGAAMADASLPGIKSFLATSGVEKSGNESRSATQQSTLGCSSFGMGTACLSQAEYNARIYTNSEFPKPMDAQAGPPSARIELRTKARERARERAKEKSSVKEPAKASCSTLPPSSAVLHDSLSQHDSFIGSADQKNIVQSSPVHDHTQEFEPQASLENQMQCSLKDVLKNFVNYATPEQMQVLSLQVPRQTAANNNLLSPSTALLQETMIQGVQQKTQMLPSFLNQIPIQSWSQTTTEHSHGLHCSSRAGSLYPSSFLHNNMAFCHNINSPLSLSCSSAISQLAVLGVPISNFTGAIMPSDRVPTPSMISLDPSQSAFRPTTQLQLPASHQERALLDYLSYQRFSGAQLSSYGVKTSDILLNSQANGIAQLASSSAFEPCNNQFHRIPSSRTSSDLQVYDHGVLGIRNTETLQSDQRLPARLRGLDEIEEQLKRSSPSGISAYHVVYPRHD